MHFKYLNIKKSRQQIVKQITLPPVPGRRSFMKKLGLGAVAWTPIVDSMKLLSQSTLDFRVSENLFELYSDSKRIWKISPANFEKGFSVHAIKTDANIGVEVKKLRIKNSELQF